jgi:hypothetical protein
VTDCNDAAKETASGPSLALEITKGEKAVAELKEACGRSDAVVAKQIRPKSIRALFGEEVVHNEVDCTDLEEGAQLDVEHFLTALKSRKENQTQCRRNKKCKPRNGTAQEKQIRK